MEKDKKGSKKRGKRGKLNPPLRGRNRAAKYAPQARKGEREERESMKMQTSCRARRAH